MEKSRHGFSLIVSIILSLGFVSFVLCFAAEFKKAKRKDLKWNGEFCYLPGTRAFELGFAVLICLSIAQIIANVVICRGFWTRLKTGSSKAKAPTAGIILLIFSWINFGIVVMLISTSTSMSREQAYGEGWLDQECYLVKQGVFLGAGGLILLNIVVVLGVTLVKTKPEQVKNKGKIHVQSV